MPAYFDRGPFNCVLRSLAVLIALCFSALAVPAYAATIEEEGAPAPGASVVAPGLQGGQSQPVTGPARPPATGPSRLDQNGNGLSDGLEDRLATLQSNDPVDVIVTFSGPGNAAAAQRAVGAFAVTHEYSLIPGFAATMTAAQARALSQTPGVFRVQLDGTVYGFMETARMDFGVDTSSGAPATSYTGQNVIVCVVDSGIWPQHEQFVSLDGETTKVEWFSDFVGVGTNATTVPGVDGFDEHYHGTFAAAIAAGDGTSVPDGDPVLAGPLRGVATDAALWGARVLKTDLATGGATGSDSDVIAGVQWCVAQWQAETAAGSTRDLIINLSLGSPGGCAGDALAATVDAAFAAGAAVFAAAGNSGDGEDSTIVPACADGAFPVAAAAEHSSPITPELTGIESLGRHVAPWSSRGEALMSGATGPGVSVASAFNTNQPHFAVLGCFDQSLPPIPDCYVALSGTSFATPFVAGIAAQMWEANPALGPSEIYQILRDTAQPWGPGGTPNIVAGAGTVDGQAAVAEALGGTACIDYTPSASPLRSIDTGRISKNGIVQIPVWVKDTGLPLSITMTIDGRVDRQGFFTPDLDMRLLDAAGNPYEVENPLCAAGPAFCVPPTLPAPGTTSTCTAGEDCGLVGVQETIHVALPPVAGDPLPVPGPTSPPHYFLEIYAWTGAPNNGKGGPYTLELSNAYTDTSVDAPDPSDCGLPPGPNDAPVLLAPINDQIVDEDTAFNLAVSGNFNDPDNQPQPLTYSVAGPGWLSVNASTGDLSGTPANGDVGVSSVTVIANDGQDSVSDTFSMTVQNVNDAPVLVTPIADQTATVDALFSLDITGNFDDVDLGDVLTYSAALPTWLALDPNSGVFSGTPTSADLGAVSVIVTASDGQESVDDTFVITVSDEPPVTVGPMYVLPMEFKKQGPNLTITVTVRLDDGDAVAEATDLAAAGANIVDVVLTHTATGFTWFTTTTLAADGNGKANYKLLRAPPGDYTFEVKNVVLDPHLWSPGAITGDESVGTFTFN
jgi:subtilisin family serine protease